MALFRGRAQVWGLSLLLSGVFACALRPAVPTVADPRLEALVEREARQILAVADAGAKPDSYRIRLAPFPRADLLGLSVGGKRIYVSYRLAQLAEQQRYHLWLLRQTLAHEIAHELAGHASRNDAVGHQPSASAITGAHLGLGADVRFQNYSLEKELQADRLGLSYWSAIGWDCANWVAILRQFQMQNYQGDALHPTDQRLDQAVRNCALQGR